MTTFALEVLGRILAVLPEFLLNGLSHVIGALVSWVAPGRRRLVLSNLDHAFPDKSTHWKKLVARYAFARVAETLMLSLAAPFLSERRIRTIARLAPSVEAFSRDLSERPRPVVLATFHLALWETQTWYKLLSPVPLPEFGIIFRPLDNPSADAFIKRTRQKHGMKLLSRKEGFAQALSILRGNGVVGILVDQNAGMQGALTLFMGRVASTTELPGVLTAKFGAELRTFYPRRTGFWRVQFESDPIAHDGTSEGATLAINRCLEGTLEGNADLCASWLWGHDRWRTQDVPERRLRLEAKRNFLSREAAHDPLPRKTRIWIRMPNWLGDVVMAIPLIRAIRTSRPDAEITLVAKPGFLPLLERFGVADALQPLPPQGITYFQKVAGFRHAYADVWILFTNSFRGDLEAWLSRTKQRFGIGRPGKRRPLLTHRHDLAPSYRESEHHQVELWTGFLQRFGLAAPADFSPLHPSGKSDGPIGLIAGSENTPEKRWPVERWRALIDALPEERFVLFGTVSDQPITSAIAAGKDPSRIEDLAGKTTLNAYCTRLLGCRLLVSNDTGGMHLANALGIPVIGLFGPTNPVRTRPVFQAPVTIVQPPGTPATGGASLEDLPTSLVVEAVRSAAK